jgi:hypothetical protein
MSRLSSTTTQTDAASQLMELTKDRAKIDYPSIREAIIDPLRGEAELLNLSAESAKAVVSTFMIQDLWEIVQAKKQTFKIDIAENSNDPLAEIIKSIVRFLSIASVDTAIKMCKDPEKIVHYHNYVLLSQVDSAFSNTAALWQLNENIVDGINTTFSLIEVALKIKAKS